MWRFNTSYLSHDGNYKYLDKYMKNGNWFYVYDEAKGTQGKTKRPTLNEQGKKVANNVKEEVTAEKNAATAEEQARHNAEMEILRDASKRTMEQHRKIMNERITSIQNMIKRMPENAKNSNVPKLRALIDKLKEDNNKKRVSLQEKYAKDSAKAFEQTRTTKQSISEAAKKTYQEELDKITSSSQYIKSSKKR